MQKKREKYESMRTWEMLPIKEWKLRLEKKGSKERYTRKERKF